MEPLRQTSKITSKIICAKCHASGTVAWESSGNNRRRLAQLSAGFVYVDRGGAGDPHCECAVCKLPALPRDGFAGERPRI